MTPDEVGKVRRLESQLLKQDQVDVETTHVFHAGMYARTVRIPARAVVTGALIKIPTLLIVSGHVTVYIGSELLELRGYHVLQGSPGRKQAFAAHEETYLTMVFPTDAETVEEAELEFTDEADMLITRRQGA